MTKSMPDQVRVFFRLVRDSDGYPPVSVESVWATLDESGGYTLDSIPFFVREATLGDTVLTSDEEGHQWFSGVLAESRNSLLRVVLFEPERVAELRRQLALLGCSSEWDEPHHLVAVNVPPSASLNAVQAYLQDGSSAGWLDYEEPILRQ